VRAKVTAARREAEIKLANLDMRVYELISLAALVPAFDLYDSVDDAVASFG
jgi:hypothetical protein